MSHETRISPDHPSGQERHVHRFGNPTTPPSKSDIVAEHLKASVPAALPDGRIPLAASDPYLIIHAPIVDIPGRVSDPGDMFLASIDGVELPETATPYANEKESFVELRIPKARIDALEEGPHALTYRAYPVPAGDIVRSGRTLIDIDRTPVGGRYLPRIAFDEDVVFDGLSIATLLSMPEGVLVGTIPDYADIYPSDTIHAFIKRRDGGAEVPAGTFSAATDGSPMVVRYDRQTLERIDGAGRVDFYYHVVDVVGLTSEKSSATPLNLSIKDGPLRLDPPTIAMAIEGFVGDAAIRPELRIDVPRLEPQARVGDTIQVIMGDKALPAVEIESDDLGHAQLKVFSISYASVRKMFAAHDGMPFQQDIHYIHRRRGVASYSEHNTYTFETTLPGGSDPLPETEANEALATPILRGASGEEDNVIDFSDSSSPATVHIAAPVAGLRTSSAIKPGDTFVVFLGSSEVGEPYSFREGDFPLALAVPAADLNNHAGPTTLSYTVTRKLTTLPHVAVARSPTQPVRIDSADALPGAGEPLPAPIFTLARAREEESGSYALTISEFPDGYTPLRILGYANMKKDDVITVRYEGFDKYDGGNPVEGTSGSIEHKVRLVDVLPKEDPDSVTGDFVYIDLRFPLEPARNLSHGHFECSHTVRNAAGTVESSKTNPLVKIRF
jgi:hypothetical protein